MKLTLDMIIYGVANYDVPEDLFHYIKAELEKQRESQPFRIMTIDNVIKKTNMAIDFFKRDCVVNKAVAETKKSRSEIEELLEKIENYSPRQ